MWWMEVLHGYITPTGNPVAGMEARGNSGLEHAETCWALRFEGIHHFGFILNPNLAEPRRIQVHLVFVHLPVCLRHV